MRVSMRVDASIFADRIAGTAYSKVNLSLSFYLLSTIRDIGQVDAHQGQINRCGIT
jgi:hypothetical protein